MTYIADAELQSFQRHLESDPAHLLMQYQMMMHGALRLWIVSQMNDAPYIQTILLAVDMETEAESLYHALMSRLGSISTAVEYVHGTAHSNQEYAAEQEM